MATQRGNEKRSHDEMEGNLEEAKKNSDKMRQYLRCDLCKFMRSVNKLCPCSKTLCLDCSLKSRKCAFCELDAPTEDNILMNAMVKLATLSCKNSLDGCPVNGNLLYIKEHELVCDYRAITCPFCDTEPVGLTVFQKHLRDLHRVEYLTVKKDLVDVKLTVKLGESPNGLRHGVPYLMRYNGRPFLAYTISCNGFLSFHLVMVGPQSAAENYIGHIFINPGTLPSKTIHEPMSSAAEQCISPKKKKLDLHPENALPLQTLSKYANKTKDKILTIPVTFGINRKFS